MDTIIAGRKPVIEALRAGTAIERVVLLAGVQGQGIADIQRLAQQARIPVVQVPRQEFRGLAPDHATQGVIAVVPARSFVELEEILEHPRKRHEQGFLLVLDEIEDPHNLGALVRTAECAGVHGVIIPKHHAATVTSAVVKTSAGATEHMPIAEVTNIAHTLKQLKDDGYWVVGLDAAGDRLYTAVDLELPIALVVGNEGRGIRRLVRERCDFLVKIPLRGKISSLNASVAGAVVMYEVLRQRTKL
ncbi:MAG: rRNA ((2251)-2'-O)-methyltransferase RlmB [Bacteroidetes bacterium]|nr:rRNA ((2251)-2'-O)-methyltransferase RlmB [Bacteroidota bacterium]